MSALNLQILKFKEKIEITSEYWLAGAQLQTKKLDAGFCCSSNVGEAVQNARPHGIQKDSDFVATRNLWLFRRKSLPDSISNGAASK